MQFLNISGRTVYMACVHRSIPPGCTFSYPWVLAVKVRGITSAMGAKAFAWRSEKGDPEVPGSPAWPDEAKATKAKAEREAKRRDEAAKAAAKAKEQRIADDEALKANMARMGHFADSRKRRHVVKVSSVKQEAPITEADVIKAGPPKSIAEAMRHNKALRQRADSIRNGTNTGS